MRRTWRQHAPEERVRLVREHDALSAEGRAALLERELIHRTTIVRWRREAGLVATVCECGAPLGKRRKRCDACVRRENRYRTVAKMYGLTREQYDELEARHGGLCAACGRPPPSTGLPQHCELHIDHDHTTGRIRGLLCSPCNLALGWALEDAERLAALAEYISTHQSGSTSIPAVR